MVRISTLICGAALALASPIFASPVMAHEDGVPDPAADGKIVGAWTQFVAGGAAAKPVSSPSVELRFVVQTLGTRSDDEYCGDYAVAYAAADGSKAVTGKHKPRTNPGKYNFPVAVCALPLDADWTHVKVIGAKGNVSDPAQNIWNAAGDTGIAVAAYGPHQIGRVHKNAGGKAELRMVTLGDTGCRGPNSSRRSLRQNCGYSSTWPLKDISSKAAKEQPDLVVHVGDYRYYKGDRYSDNWPYWLKDFVEPSRDLLLAAPLAAVRGNHESCSKEGGPGYFYLFGAHKAAVQCGSNDTATWYFDVAPGGIDKSGKATAPHRTVMIDTSAISRSQSKTNFETAIDMSAPQNTWWATHVPPMHLVVFGSDPSKNTSVAKGLNDALTDKGFKLCDSKRNPKPACVPSTLLLGHDHMFQTVEYKNSSGRFEYPQMYIVGHGGVNLRGAGLNGSPCKYKFKDLPGAGNDLDGVVNTRKDFGYVVWTRSQGTADTPTGWSAEEKWVSSNHSNPNPAKDCL